jgi:UDP-glucose 6-dehydrogenase
LSYHPEFIAQGDIMNGTLKPDMALIGEGSKAAGDVLEEMVPATLSSSSCSKICYIFT